MLHIELVTLTVSVESIHLSLPRCCLETCLSARIGQSASEAGCMPMGSHSPLIQSVFILSFQPDPGQLCFHWHSFPFILTRALHRQPDGCTDACGSWVESAVL